VQPGKFVIDIMDSIGCDVLLDMSWYKHIGFELINCSIPDVLRPEFVVAELFDQAPWTCSGRNKLK
jgi:hypothetical protein